MLRDWRAWVWPLVAGGLVLAITVAGVLTVPEKTETRARKHPPAYVKQAALTASRENGDPQPRAVEWIVTTHAAVADALGIEDDRPGIQTRRARPGTGRFHLVAGGAAGAAGAAAQLLARAALHDGHDAPRPGRPWSLRAASGHPRSAALKRFEW